MGLDLALGALILFMAVRGWFKGFVLQAVRLAGVVACVYAADPVRDQAKPRVLAYLPAMKPELVDRLLWWSAAVVSYVVLVGLATVAVKIYRRHPYGLVEPNRGDQFAGSMLGMAKGALIATFMVAGIEQYALSALKTVPWAEQQTRTSKAMAWNTQYQPVPRIWSAPPVRSFVNRVKQRGLNSPAAPSADATPVQTAARAPRLQWEASAQPPAGNKALDPEIARAVEEIKNELRKAQPSN